MDIIILKSLVTEEEIKHIHSRITALGFKTNISEGVEKIIIGVIGDTSRLSDEEINSIKAMPGIEDAIRILKPYKLVSREFKKADTIIDVRGILIGDRKIPVIAGPCAVENRSMLLNVAKQVKEAGALFIRGGAYKPRTSPYSFKGLGEEALKYLAEIRDKTGMPVVTEVMDPRDLHTVVEYADIIQIGARNMQNYSLLGEVGYIQKPVLLKRGLCARIEEWLLAAEYIILQGNQDVILCERGIRTFETATRNTVDLSAVPLLKQLTHLPVIVDPSHGVGRSNLVIPMARAAIAAGTDGLLIEVHPNPEEALSDGDQSLRPDDFKRLMNEIKSIAKAVGREMT
jgi:3-deoxy-7-phosphoheptulonate synthase